MLQFLSEGAKGGIGKIIIFGFIGLGAAGLVLTDVRGFFSGGVSARNVAEIGSTQISLQEYDARLRLSLGRQGITPQEAHAIGLTGQLLQAMVGETIFRKAAAEYGLKVPRQYIATELNETISNMVAENPDVTKEQALANMLRAQRMTEEKFVKTLAQETATRLLNRALFEGVYVPDVLAKDLKLYADHTRDVRVVYFKNTAQTKITQPSDEDLRAFYEKRKSLYVIPEYRKFAYAEISSDNLADEINITDEQIEDFYENNKDLYTTSVQRRIEQSLINDAEAAREIHAKVKNEGLSLKDATTAVTGNESAYRESDWYEQSGLLEAVSTPAFEAKIGSLAEPVKSPLGWHVFKVTDERAADTTPLSKLKTDIRKTLKAEALSDSLFELTEEIDDALAGGDTLESLAQNYSLKLKETPLITVGGVSQKGAEPFKGFEVAPELLTEGFDLEQGESSQLIEGIDGNYVALQVKDVQEKGYENFEDVKSRLSKLYVDEERRKASLKQATDFMSALTTKGFDDAAKDAGAKILRINNLKNNNKQQDILTADNIRQVFSLSKADDTRLFVNAQGNGVMILDKVNLRSTPILDRDIADSRQELQSSFRDTVFQTYVYALFNQYHVDLNLNALDMMYGQNDQF